MSSLLDFNRNNDVPTDFFDNFGKSFLSSWAGSNPMRADLIEQSNQYVASIDLPGFRKEDIEINYNDDYLVVKATKDINSVDNTKDGRILRRERSTTNLKRSFYLPKVDSEQITAKYDNGVLQINLPKSTNNVQSNHIKIN